jgi:hypothetical protein
VNQSREAEQEIGFTFEICVVSGDEGQKGPA